MHTLRVALAVVGVGVGAGLFSGCGPAFDILQLLPAPQNQDDGGLRMEVQLSSSEDPTEAPRGATLEIAGHTIEMEPFDRGLFRFDLFSGSARSLLIAEIVLTPEELEVDALEIVAHVGFTTSRAAVTNTRHGIHVTADGAAVAEPLPRNRVLEFTSDRPSLQFLEVEAEGARELEQGRVEASLTGDVTVHTEAEAVFECIDFAQCFSFTIPRSVRFDVE